MELGKYSFGIGDRFNHEGEAQLRSIIRANLNGVEISPVWNKSNREHDIVSSEPEGTRREADNAVKKLKWDKPYFVDADHINFSNVDRFIGCSNFFTIDVALYIGKQPMADDVIDFKNSCLPVGTEVNIPGISRPFIITENLINEVSEKYLVAIKAAAKIYNYIENKKGRGNFITEISMDEVDSSQTPIDILLILKMIANENIPVQTIAPKFTGRFNKGVDYFGDVSLFAKEFEQDVLVIDYAINNFGLPKNLKLSIHSGSDKFSIYPVMAEIIKKHGAGLHVKTAGTTWLEEVIGLSVSSDEGLLLAKKIYNLSLERREELCAPYSDVIDINESELPTSEEVVNWTSKKFADTLRHIPDNTNYNPNFRQLIHVGYKVAAEMGSIYTDLLKRHSEVIGKCVEENIYERHLKRLFYL